MIFIEIQYDVCESWQCQANYNGKFNDNGARINKQNNKVVKRLKDLCRDKLYLNIASTNLCTKNQDL